MSCRRRDARSVRGARPNGIGRQCKGTDRDYEDRHRRLLKRGDPVRGYTNPLGGSRGQVQDPVDQCLDRATSLYRRRRAAGDITVAGFIDVLDAVNAGAPPPEGSFEAGAVFSAPGKFPHRKNFDFTVPGQYGFFCPITTPAGTPHYKLGFVGLFDVVAP